MNQKQALTSPFCFRMEMRGNGLDTESRSPSPEDLGEVKDEVYWWLHFHKLQDFHAYFKGTLFEFEICLHVMRTRIFYI